MADRDGRARLRGLAGEAGMDLEWLPGGKSVLLIDRAIGHALYNDDGARCAWSLAQAERYLRWIARPA